MPYNPKSLENLKKGRQFKSGTGGEDDASKNGKKGSDALIANIRKRATMQSIAKTIASSPAPDKAKKTLAQLGIEEEDMNGNALVVAGVYNRAIHGDEKAVEKWESWSDIVSADEKPFELPARVVGKAFVDLNRQILPNIKYVIEGGRGSTKSTFISEKLIELLKNNPNMHACVVRKVGSTLKDSVYAQVKWAINTLGLDEEFKFKASPLEIELKATGQTIFFRGCDDPVKLKSIKPPFGYLGILWIEERDQLSGPEEERNVKQSVLRGGDISYEFVSYNPPKSRESWVNKENLIPDEKRVIHHSTYLDVPREWLGTKFIEDAEHLKEVNPAAYEHEYMGVPNGDGGAVFDNIEVKTITQSEIDTFDHIYMGVDWGWYPDPFAFIRLHYDRAREKIYFIDEIRAQKTVNEETARMIREKRYTDGFITCDSAEPKSVADFRACGLPAKEAIKGPGSVEYGLKWLQGRTLVIDPARTPHAYKEFIEYEYQRDKDGNVISGYPDANNHFIDAVRYALERVWRTYWSIG